MSANLQAVLDIGSNTIRLLIAEVKSKNRFKRVHYQHHIARLGEGLQLSGKLGEAGKSRALAVFLEVIKVCESFAISARDIRAVATAAVREADNGHNFVAEVGDKTGLNIQVISGDEEALLALKGAKLGLPQAVGQDMLLFDIGGGSTEFSRVSQGKLQDSISVKLGVVRLTELFLTSNPPLVKEYDAMKKVSHEFLTKVEDSWGDNRKLPTYLVGTAGTVTTLAAIAQNMRHYEAEFINGYSMPVNDFYTLRNRLKRMTNEKRVKIPSLEKGREDVIIAGLAIIDVLFERWNYDALISVDSGLLEGLLIVK